MKKRLAIFKSPVFLICCSLFLLHQFLERVWPFSVPVTDAYLDSFLALPIILPFLVAERRILFKRGGNYRLSALEVTLATLLIAFVSEVLFPLFSDDFTTDWVDLIFYALGGMLFYFTINNYPRERTHPE